MKKEKTADNKGNRCPTLISYNSLQNSIKPTSFILRLRSETRFKRGFFLRFFTLLRGVQNDSSMGK